MCCSRNRCQSTLPNLANTSVYDVAINTFSSQANEFGANYAAKQREQVESFKACGFDFAGSVYAGNLPGHTCKALEYHNMDWITAGALDFLDAWKQTEKPFFLYMATTLNHGPGPANRKYTGDPLATPAGLLGSPLDVQPPRSSIPKRVRKAGLSVEGPACDLLWLDDGIGADLPADAPMLPGAEQGEERQSAVVGPAPPGRCDGAEHQDGGE